MKKKYAIDRDDLREIRNNADWKRIWEAFDIRKDEKRSKEGEWWGLSPFILEKNSSFHMSDRGFYCFSSGINGGKIELIQALLKEKFGTIVNCYEAGKWLVDNGLSYCSSNCIESQNQQIKFEYQKTKKKARSEKKEKVLENLPIRQNLLPLLSMQGEHAEFLRRGISKATCEYLGCGFLENGKLRNKKHVLNDRIVFQVRGVQNLKPVILSHIGRATTEEQKEKNGKWWGYGGFSKSLELYNIDKLFINGEIILQARNKGFINIVEGCFDVAKLVETGVFNVISTFGASLSEKQISKINFIAEVTGIKRFKVWFDRDQNQAGDRGQTKAVELLKSQGFQAVGFDWNQTFGKNQKRIPESLSDPCDFSVQQLQYLQAQKLI